MKLGLLRIYFDEDDVLPSKWPKASQGLRKRLFKRHKVLVQGGDPSEHHLLIVLSGFDWADIQLRMDDIVEECTVYGIGRISEEVRAIHDVDDLLWGADEL